MKYPRGFTLIELMVVIAIIGLLATIITASLTSARSKGRDARRLADIKILQTSLELYFNDHLSYPTTLAGLVPNYMPVIPTDPGGAGAYKYAPISNNGGICNAGNPAIRYHLAAILEQANNAGLTQDVDAATNANVCTGSSDFNGQSVGCAGAQLSATQNDPAVTTETCYDWAPN